MTKQQLRKFINDTRGLIRGASNDKKLKLLKLIKEAKRQCDEQELAEMTIDHSKIDGVLGSKIAQAALSGALSATGASHTGAANSIQPNTQKNADYLEEK